MSSYVELDGLRIPLEHILIATNKFSEENLLKRSETSDVYKGVLPCLQTSKLEIQDVVIRKYSSHPSNFYDEIKRVSRLKYTPNVVCFIGFCDEKNERMIVMEHVANGSLDKNLRDTTTLKLLSQRLKVCYGAAFGLRECFNFGIKGDFKILLDKEWEAKVLIVIGSESNNASLLHNLRDILLSVLYKEGEQLTSDSYLEERMHPGSLSLFQKTTSDCLEKQPNTSSFLSDIMYRLRRASDLQWKHENLPRVEKIVHLKNIAQEEITSAVNSFDSTHYLEAYKYNKVYKAELQKKKVIIVCISKEDDHMITKASIVAQIEMLHSCEHTNLLPFLGFCEDEYKLYLVFEYASNETLIDYLKSPGPSSWEQRIRISLGVAHGLKYLHDKKTKLSMIHQVMQSGCIFLDEEWTAKIANFNLLLHLYFPWEVEQYTRMGVVGDHVYFLGVVLFEILTGRLVEDPRYIIKQVKGLATLKNMIDPTIMEKDQNSVDVFTEITYQCLALETPKERPTLEVVIKSLERSHFQIRYASLKIPLNHIKLATNNFADSYRIMLDTHDQLVYKARLVHFASESVLTIGDQLPSKTVIIYAIDKNKKNPKELYVEIEMLTKCKHTNLLSLLGFCEEENEMILVFECEFKETLNDHLRSGTSNLSWEQRIRISLDIAHGLQYLHNMKDMISSPMMLHVNVLQSASVLLDEKCSAMIANFWLDPCPPPYSWPSIKRLDVAEDIHSLGVILFQILTGKLDYDSRELKKIMVDPMINKYAQSSLDTFSQIMCQCLAVSPSKRPILEDVITSLDNALYLQQTMLLVQKLEHMKISLELIKIATNNFGEEFHLGSGAYGEVFKATLEKKSDDTANTHTVAIKRMKNRNGVGVLENKGFFSELEIAGQCHHPNIISLIGFCVEDSEMLLVYELASLGSLNYNLGSIKLTWEERLKLCIEIADGLKYIHTTMDDKSVIIHRDIKSDNILLGNDWKPKIADFGLSKVQQGDQGASTIETVHIAGTDCYMDPEYAMTGKLKKASDIYSLGVVLFEIFSGKVAYDSNYIKIDRKGLASVARKYFRQERLKDLLDAKIMHETFELGFTRKVEPDKDSLEVFSKIAIQCVAKTQVERPKIEDVIKELQKALNFQENQVKTLKFSLDDIRSGVEKFSDDICIVRGGYGTLYKGNVKYKNGEKKVLVNQFSQDKFLNDRKNGFLKEFEVLFKYKHDNIIRLEGYCTEMGEKIILYEHASKGSLDRYLKDINFTWTKRLKVCIDIAKGLKFLHEGDSTQDVVIHRDLKSSNILLTEDWKAKIYGFEHAVTHPPNQEIVYVMDQFEGSPGYSDPLYWGTRAKTKDLDIYSFGVILFEILCGSSAVLEEITDKHWFLDRLVKKQQLPKMVFEGIKEQIAPMSLDTFSAIAFECLPLNGKRPTASDMVAQLHKALKFQEEFETKAAKLNSNDKETLSKSPEIYYSEMAKNDIYNILSKGDLLEADDILKDCEQLETEMHKHYEYLRNFSKSPRILSRMMKRYIKDILSMGILLEDDKREIIGDIVETMLATEDGTSTGMCKRGEGETEMLLSVKQVESELQNRPEGPELQHASRAKLALEVQPIPKQKMAPVEDTSVEWEINNLENVVKNAKKFSKLPLIQDALDRVLNVFESYNYICHFSPHGMYPEPPVRNLILLGDMLSLFTREWLDISVIVTFVMCLFEDASDFKCAILDPRFIYWLACKQQRDCVVTYMKQMHAYHIDKKYFLLPYLESDHWSLFIVEPSTASVYIVDSINKEKTKDSYEISKLIPDGFNRRFTWTTTKCTKQMEGWECGYMVVKHMWEFVNGIQHDFLNKMWKKDEKIMHDELDLIVVELANIWIHKSRLLKVDE